MRLLIGEKWRTTLELTLQFKPSFLRSKEELKKDVQYSRGYFTLLSTAHIEEIGELEEKKSLFEDVLLVSEEI